MNLLELIDFNNEIQKLIAYTSADLIPKELLSFVQPALEQFKFSIADEIGLKNYDAIKKDLPSAINGQVGGLMIQRMVLFAEAVLAWNYKQNLINKR